MYFFHEIHLDTDQCEDPCPECTSCQADFWPDLVTVAFFLQGVFFHCPPISVPKRKLSFLVTGFTVTA